LPPRYRSRLFRTRKDGAAAGATTGAVTGAVVGGPVGAAVGAGVGAVAGGIADDTRPRFRSYVSERRVPSYRYEREVRVGEDLPSSGVTYYEVPREYGVTKYRYTVVNDRPVLVDPARTGSSRSLINDCNGLISVRPLPGVRCCAPGLWRGRAVRRTLSFCTVWRPNGSRAEPSVRELR